MTDIRVPKLNNNDEEYILTEWLVGDREPVKPDDALATCAQIMQEQLDLFTGFNAEEKPVAVAPTSEWDVPVETLNLSVRSFNCLKRAGISKVSELLDMTEDEIIKMRNFGKKSLDEIKQVLEERGLSLRQS